LSKGLPAERNEGTSLAITLVNQFALMQQQMFDQMTQATMMMAQMFGQMQDKQMQLIREELGHLHDLTKELHALQADLLKHSRAAPQPAAARAGGERTTPAPTKNESRAGAQHRPSLRGRPDAVERTSAACTDPGANPRTPTPVVAAAGQSQEDIHAVLCARIEALQQDRQSRWQSILHFMTGKRSAGSTSPAE
jgi:hypothetical protein